MLFWICTPNICFLVLLHWLRKNEGTCGIRQLKSTTWLLSVWFCVLFFFFVFYIYITTLYSNCGLMVFFQLCYLYFLIYYCIKHNSPAKKSHTSRCMRSVLKVVGALPLAWFSPLNAVYWRQREISGKKKKRQRFGTLKDPNSYGSLLCSFSSSVTAAKKLVYNKINTLQALAHL